MEGGLRREMGRAEGVPREEAGEGGQCRGAVRDEGALQKFGERAEEAGEGGLSMEASLLDNEGQGELVEVGDLGAASGGGVHGGGGSGLGGAGAVGGGWAVVKGVGGIGAKVRGTLRGVGVTREEATWHETPKFASTDIRFSIKSGDIHEEKRSASPIVNELNLFARQGPGGLYDLNGYSCVRYCKLCEKQCTCLSKCSGPPPPLKSRVSKGITVDRPSSIPGLNEGGVASTSLTKIEETSQSPTTARYHKLRDMFNGSENFNYQGVRKPPSHPSSSSFNRKTSKYKVTKTQIKVIEPKSDSMVGENKELQLLLINCGPRRKHKNKSRKPSTKKSSLQRKLDISEIPCARRKSRKPSTLDIPFLPTNFQSCEPDNHSFPILQQNSSLKRLVQSLTLNMSLDSHGHFFQVRPGHLL